MKIQFFGGTTFTAETKENRFAFDPTDAVTGDYDFVTFADGKGSAEISAKKALTIPGEFEISEALIRGFRTENGANTIFKVTVDEMSIVHFGTLTEVPNIKLLEQIGENIDIGIFNLSDKFTAKKGQEILEKVEPRLAIFGGAASQFPEIKALTNAQIEPESVLKVQRSKLSDEVTEVKILTV